MKRNEIYDLLADSLKRQACELITKARALRLSPLIAKGALSNIDYSETAGAARAMEETAYICSHEAAKMRHLGKRIVRKTPKRKRSKPR